MTTQHTPGPWKYQNAHDGNRTVRVITNGGPSVVAIMADTEASGSLAPLFNAKLCAAAPELLEALRNLADHVFRLESKDNVCSSAWLDASDAIEKATGARDQ